MNKTLLFLPDISGYTEFVQQTEINHSQHVIAELLEVLIASNSINMQLAEIEGDALFFYKEEIPFLEKLLAQVESVFTAFYSHLKLLEKNRICPCAACSTAPNLKLKIIAHCGDIEFISVLDKRKPYGIEVIEVHRLMKNSVKTNQYVLFSRSLADELGLSKNYQSKLFHFVEGVDTYDAKELSYVYSIIEKEKLKLKPFRQANKVNFVRNPDFVLNKEFPISAKALFEYVSNFEYRMEFTKGADELIYNPKEINRLDAKHVCVVNGEDINFITVTKEVKSNQLVYGEMTSTPKPIDAAYVFYIITPLEKNTCLLEIESYIEVKSIFKKLLRYFVVRKAFLKSTETLITNLFDFVLTKRE